MIPTTYPHQDRILHPTTTTSSTTETTSGSHQNNNMLLLEMDSNVHSPRKRISSSSSSSSSGTTKKGVVRVDPRLTTSSTRLRSNLLRKLGIPPSSASYKQLQQQNKQQQQQQHSLLANVKVQRIPLKTDEMDRKVAADGSRRPSCHTDKVFQAWGSLWTKQPPPTATVAESPATSHTSSTSTTGSSLSVDSHRRHVHFDQDVQVAWIPTRHEYSNRIRRFLWDSPQEMQSSIIRNTLEFTADGWDHNTCLEEEEHYYNPNSGEYIHPVHLEIAQMPPEEQEDICPPNYINPALVTVGVAPTMNNSTTSTVNAAATTTTAAAAMQPRSL